MPVRPFRPLAITLIAILALAAAPAEKPTDLNGLYLLATEFDPLFQRARLENEVAVQGLKESRSYLLPSVSANAQGSKVYQDIKNSQNFLFAPGKSDYFDTSFSISLSQSIYHSEQLARVGQARAEIRQADAQFAAAEQDLVMRVAQTYFDILAARSNLDLASAERQAIAAQLSEAQERLASGLVKMTDVADARARFALAQAAEIEARSQVDAARQALAEIVGFAPFNLKALSDTLPLVEPDRPDVESWVQTGLFQHPRVQALQAGVDAAAEEIRRQQSARRPTLDLVASYNNSDSGGTVFGGGNEIARSELGLRLGIPILDGGRVSALTASARLRQNIVLQELEREKRRVEREARDAYNGVIDGIARVQSLVQSVFANEVAVAEKEEGWRSGLNTAIVVLDAQRELFKARRDLAHARYRYILSSLRLKQAAGFLAAQDLRQIDAYLQ